MTNIIPQTPPENNRGPWRELEKTTSGIWSTSMTIAFISMLESMVNGELWGNPPVTVPSRLWKIVIVYGPYGRWAIGAHGQHPDHCSRYAKPWCRQ